MLSPATSSERWNGGSLAFVARVDVRGRDQVARVVQYGSLGDQGHLRVLLQGDSFLLGREFLLIGSIGLDHGWRQPRVAGLGSESRTAKLTDAWGRVKVPVMKGVAASHHTTSHAQVVVRRLVKRW